MSKEWYLQHNGTEVGPASSTRLKELAAAGKINKETKIRLGEAGKWVDASSVRGLWTQTVMTNQSVEQVAEDTAFSNQPASLPDLDPEDEFRLQPATEFRVPLAAEKTTKQVELRAQPSDDRPASLPTVARPVSGNLNVPAIVVGSLTLIAISVGSLLFFMLRPEPLWERTDWQKSVPAFEEAFEALDKHFDADRNLMPRAKRAKMGKLMSGRVVWDVQYAGEYKGDALLNPQLPHFMSKLSDKLFAGFSAGDYVRIAGTFRYFPPANKTSVSHRGEQFEVYLGGDCFGLQSVTVSAASASTTQQQ